MGPISKNPDLWLPELREALSAVSLALNGHAATPELLEEVRNAYEDVIPRHRVIFEWYPHGYLFPEGRGQAPWPAEYGLLIQGDAFKSGWLIRSNEFDAVLDLLR